MWAKNYLMQARYIDKEINLMQLELDQMRELLTSPKTATIKGDVVQEGGRSHYDDKYNKLIGLNEEISHKIDEFIDLKNTMRRQIEKIEDPRYRLVLTSRYINCIKDWDDIAQDLAYSEKYIFELHGQALIEFEKVNSLPNLTDSY